MKKIATISVATLRDLQFTVRKCEYIIDIAKLMAGGALTTEKLLQKENDQDIKKSINVY